MRRRVAVGDTVRMVLAETTTKTYRLMDAIGGEVRTVRILDGCVEILEPDGVTFALATRPSFDIVGVHRDRLGLWVEPIPARLTQVFRHGKPVSVPMTREVHAVRWLEDHTPWTAVRCLADEGYQIVEVRNGGEPLERHR